MKSYIKTDKENRIEGSPRGKKSFKQDKSNISFERILDVICKECYVSKEKILSNNRNAYTEYPRHIIMYLAHTLLYLSHEEIATKLYGKNKTGVKSGINRIINDIRNDTQNGKNTRELIDRITSILSER